VVHHTSHKGSYNIPSYPLDNYHGSARDMEGRYHKLLVQQRLHNHQDLRKF